MFINFLVANWQWWCKKNVANTYLTNQMSPTHFIIYHDFPSFFSGNDDEKKNSNYIILFILFLIILNKLKKNIKFY